jgi:hypothetical protein
VLTSTLFEDSQGRLWIGGVNDDQLDSSAFYAERALKVAREAGLFADAVRTSTMLSTLFEKGDLKRANKYAHLAIAYNDSLSFMRKNGLSGVHCQLR